MFLSLGFLINQTQDDIVVLFCSVYFLSLDFLRNQTWVERNIKRHLCSVSFLLFLWILLEIKWVERETKLGEGFGHKIGEKL